MRFGVIFYDKRTKKFILELILCYLELRFSQIDRFSTVSRQKGQYNYQITAVHNFIL